MSASPASYPQGAYPSALLPGQTLRGLLETRRAHRQALALEEAISIAVPLALDLKQRHERGERWLVHPSCIVGGPNGLARLEPKLSLAPADPRDRACLAPEQQSSLAPGGARASVFSIGAILYESVVGTSVGPAMRRPSSVIANIPDAFEVLLAKALVGDPAHRPEDLGALASALHHLAPMRSMHPPEADETRLDHAEGFDVDIRLSMLPPSELASQLSQDYQTYQDYGAIDPQESAARPKAAVPPPSDPTARLAMLKEQLESDPRPRYVVSKDRMDHGPFSAVELLQQIASNAFTSAHLLRDEISGQEHTIAEWPEFAPFAEQAGLKREIVAEKRAVAQVEITEKKAGAAKIVISVSAVLAVAIVVGIFFYKKVGSRNDDVVLSDDPNAVDYDLQGGVKGQKRPAAPGSRGGGGGGGGGGAYAGGGMSYETALANNVQEVAIGSGGKPEPDLTDAQLSAPLKNAKFISGCGAPSDMSVTVKVAIKNGRAVGVSVYPNPANAGVASCIDHAVRGLSWPSNSKMDTLTTTY
ncbi:hypothetical protein [Pendulispora albinea]|uniref:Protein kinase domain-containing protein n=1 Tax=Pendulispora albinea TaxID=2741071 RepID=A0ABZ2LJ24_9BACT